MHKLFGYPGGKWPVRNLIISSFPEHKTYVDVFGGSAAILLTKSPSDGEVFNDKNEEIVNLFRVVKHRTAELAERARVWLHSRLLFNEMKAYTSPGDELERAFRYWVLLADSFGGIGGTYGTARDGIRSVTKARAYLVEVAERLQNVHIEGLDFSKCISTYDAPETFFYCDPPYLGTKGGDSHYEQLSADDWKKLRDMLSGIKGKFLLSSNDDKSVLKLFNHFHIRPINVRVTLPKNQKAATRREVLISNYVLPWTRSRSGKPHYAIDRKSNRSTHSAGSLKRVRSMEPT